MLKLRKGLFTIDGCGKVFEGYTAGERWNGWACPRFKKEVGHEIISVMNTEDCPAFYNEQEDTFEFTVTPGSKDQNDIDSFGPYSVEIDGKIERLYPIGAWAWTWVETDEEGNWI